MVVKAPRISQFYLSVTLKSQTRQVSTTPNSHFGVSLKLQSKKSAVQSKKCKKISPDPSRYA